ncbi:MAG: hypothetical protein QOI61_727 [Actinomycetota bacterium]
MKRYAGDVVGIAQKLVVVVAALAGLLGALADRLPESIPTTVPAACVQVPILNSGGLQAGYCP